jgi:transcriptional regulator with XRE-family HTH domain
MSVFALRLKEARIRLGLSQEKLGVLAGIDEASSSARMNQYERGKHTPDSTMVARLAQALNVPEAFFYAQDDELAWLLIQWHRADKKHKKIIIECVRQQLSVG